MCGGSSPAPPTAPDPQASANAQIGIDQAAITQAAGANEVNQSNPFGTSTWTPAQGVPGQPGYVPASQSTQLSAPIQQELTTQEGTSNTMANDAAAAAANIQTGPLNVGETNQAGQIGAIQDQAQQYSGAAVNPLQTSYASGGPIQMQIAPALGQIQTGLSNTGQAVQGQLNTSGVQQIEGPQSYMPQANEAAAAAYQQQTGLLQPQMSQQQEQLQSQLAAQGIVPGTAAYNQASTLLANQQNSTLQQAAASAVGQGMTEQQALAAENLAGSQAQFGQAQGTGAFANTAAAQQFSNALQSGQFGNQAQAESFGENATSMQAANAAQAQQNQQNAQAAQFYNQAEGQQLQEGLSVGQYDQGITNAQTQNEIGLQQANQQQYTAAQGNAIAAQNQPLNVQSAIMGGTPVSPANPSFQSTPQYSPNYPNYMGLVGSEYGTQGSMYGTQVQANAASNGSIFGAAGNILGGLAGNSGLFGNCWVAREVYGAANPRWREFRSWLLFTAPRWLRSLYAKHGPKFAIFIRNKPRVKSIIRSMMEAALAH